MFMVLNSLTGRKFFLYGVMLLVALTASRVFGGQAVQVRYSTGFTVEKRGEFTLVTVKNPWPGAKTGFTYLLKPRGVKQPPGYDHCQVVEVPVKKMVVLSTTLVAFMEELGLTDRLVGFSDLSRVHSPAIRQAAEEGKVVAVGQGPKLQIETVLDLDPDVIFTFATGSFRDAHPKLLEAGLKVAVIGEYMESHPLGRAEWLKFFALFFNRDSEAEAIFNSLEQRYLATAEVVKGILKRPTVITGVPFNGRWYIAGGNSFVGKLLQDAGGDYIWKHTTHTGSLPVDIELVFEQGAEAQYWLNPGIWTSQRQAEAADPRFAGFKALTRHRLYNNNRRVNQAGGNDYWESGMMQPDSILADLIHILHPNLLPDHQLLYYLHLQ